MAENDKPSPVPDLSKTGHEMSEARKRAMRRDMPVSVPELEPKKPEDK